GGRPRPRCRRHGRSAAAYFVAFDVVQIDGEELLHAPYRHCRTHLEKLFTDHNLTAPWTLRPMKTDLAKARHAPAGWGQFVDREEA
ncbi:hypothetical protein VR46_38590, partial [Streptomyces sp. NRRL S-444]